MLTKAQGVNACKHSQVMTGKTWEGLNTMKSKEPISRMDQDRISIQG